MKKVINNVKFYEIDSFGNVYGPRGLLKSFVSNTGYQRVCLYTEDGPKKFSVHRLVAEAFLPNPKNKPYINHKDGNKLNNKVDNLEWSTASENMIHARDMGLTDVGIEKYNNVYSEEQIHTVCSMMEEGYRNCDICLLTDIPKSTVSQIRNGVVWLHISREYNIQRFRQRRISVDTVTWICEQLEKGFSVSEIEEMSTNKEVRKSLIYDIKSRKSYSKISAKFKF